MQLLVLLMALNALPAFAQTYCTPAPTSVDGIGITNVTIGSINNSTGVEAGNYGNFTTQIVNVGQTVQQAFSITLGAGPTYDMKIWIDWNDDFDFTDAGEEVFSGVAPAANPATITGNFTVPATAPLGNHRMRVGGVDFGPPTPCWTAAWGSFEDYTINVTVPPSCPAPTNAVGVGVASGTANLSWTAPALGTPTGYEYVVDTNTAAPTTAGTPVTGTTVTGFTPITDNTFYYLHVRANCGTDGYSEWTTSPRFRYLLGDTCAAAINLGALTSPVISTNADAGNDYTPTCGFGAGRDVFYSIPVPVGYTLVIGLTASSYDSVHSIFYGNCTTSTQILCTDTEIVNTTWENTTGSDQTVYWVQDAWGNATGNFTLAWTLTAPPACNIPRTLTATLTSLTTANISWTAPVTGTPQGYEYAITTSNTPPASGTATTELSVTGVTATELSTNYVYVRANCGQDGYSEWVRTSFYAGHCVPAPTSVDGRGIINVTIGSINNTTIAEAGNYGDYTAQVVTIGQGVAQPFSITYGAGPTYDTRIWVDWNNDLDFNDEGELVYTGMSAATNPATLTGTITVPLTASLGNHRMRVGGVDFGPPTPCWTGTWGSFEDYTINVTPPPACPAVGGLAATATSGTTANISWTAVANATGYEYAVTTSATPPAGGTATTETSVTGVTITTNVTNYLHVRNNCGTDGYSLWTTYSFYVGYCIPAPTSVDGRGIINVTIGSINNTTIAEAGNYGDYSAQIATIGQGVEQPFSITYGAGPTYDTRIWVDWNNDLDFNDEGELVYTGVSAATNPATLTGTITVPLTASLGNHRMRVGGVDFGTITPCYNGSWGSFEDYTINVTPPPACPAVRGLAATATSPTTATISWTAVAGATGYEYAVTTSLTPPADGTATTATSVTDVTITTNVTNYLHVRNNCNADGYSLWSTYSFYVGYCRPAPTSVDGTGITNVSIGSINNTTAAEAGNYGDFTNLVVNIGQGVEQQFSVTLATNSATYDTKIWVDWNNDLDFNDVGEEVYTATTPGGGGTLTGIITVPPTASLGYHRMRVGGVDFGPPTPCWTATWGSFEDYTINVTVPPTCSTPRNALGVAVAQGTANLSWSAPALGNAPTGYEYVVDLLPGAPTGAGTPTTETSVTGYTSLLDNTYYYLHVRANCGTDGYSEWITSVRFRYLAGDTCASAINLSTLQSPYSSTTIGAANDYTPLCSTNTNAPDMYYYIQVPNGYTLNIGQTTNGYDSIHSVLYGACGSLTSIACMDAPDALNDTNGANSQVRWENLTGSSQTVYWVQDGYNTGAGVFTLQWTLTGPATCDVPRTPTVLLTSPSNANISWTAPNTGSPAGYEYFVSTSQNPPATGTFTTELSVLNVAVTPNATNYLHVRSNCGDVDGNSLWVSTTFFGGYCVPTHTGSTANYISGITTTGAESNITNNGTAFSGYTDYSQQHSVTTYAAGSFTVIGTHPTGTATYTVWVDWNNDFDFDDAGETEIVSAFLTSPATIGSVSVPPNAAVGSYRMRIRNANFGTPTPACGNFAFGEAEDYTLIVAPTPTCFAPYGLEIIPQEDVATANLTWGTPILGTPPVGYEYVFGPVQDPTTVNSVYTTAFYIFDVTYNPAVSNYLHVRSVCGDGDYSPWATTAILDTNTPELISRSVMVYKEGNGINITSANAQITGVTIYDTRGSKLYTQTGINANQTVIDGMQIQQQVLILQINTDKGTVSKRIVY